MKIIRDDGLATFTFVPVGNLEEMVIENIIGAVQPGVKIYYLGRGEDDVPDKFCTTRFNAGGIKKDQTTHEGKLTVTETGYDDGVEFVLRGTSEQDKHEVNAIRDICFTGPGGLIFLEVLELDGKKAICVTASYCKLCGAQMIKRSRCEWKVCDTCADKCGHNYVRGAIHGGKADIAVGNFCNICGRAAPKPEGEREKSVLEHHLEVERELGISVTYTNFPFTPGRAVQIERLARRLEKARSRSRV